MARIAAGLLLYRLGPAGLEVLLVHPGGPLWARRDDGAWTIPKGEPQPGEELLAAARREAAEELGTTVQGAFVALPPCTQRGGKTVHAWAVRADFDPLHLRSNEFTMEWPPRSGRVQAFPEVDRAAWFTLDTARTKIIGGQRPLLEAVAAHVAATE